MERSLPADLGLRPASLHETTTVGLSTPIVRRAK